MRPTETTSSRTWLSPLSAVAYIVIAVTGILMFFHIRFPGMTMLHELGGLLFVVVAALHIKANWRALLSYCRQRKGRLALCLGAGLTALLLVLGLGHEQEHRGHMGGPPRQGMHDR